MLVIRLARAGSKKRPYYHITVAESSVARDGRFVERLGFFNPVARGATEGLRFDLERYEHWVRQGATPSDRVKDLARTARKTGGTPTAEPAPAPESSEEAAA